MFKKILIANRGEIACRIMKTAQRMGIKTVAIYSKIDATSPHVLMADEAFYIADDFTNSYLNIPEIIRIAQLSNANAIHPGYGFLSENLEFAQACKDANIIWIGPSCDSMYLMASKKRAKQHVMQHNIPITPGFYANTDNDAALLQQAQLIGFPVIIKAAMGGGGKGMRTVYFAEDFMSAITAARREAQLIFADQTLLIEKYIEYSRHIEVQIMADNHGHTIHLYTRDCSIQRRHQKIIEEAPAPNIDNDLAEKLTNTAIKIAESINYHNAGTIEFLVDEQNNFYFMEMNTRLQVEHPVTEMITGLDLVEWQIRIANNEVLDLPKVSMRGHAIECRIYAEDPTNEFLPSIGHIKYLEEPKENLDCNQSLRIDSGIQIGSYVSQYYDPLLSKIIAWGETRADAIYQLHCALNKYSITGIKTNIPFLNAILIQKAFITPPYYTNFLQKNVITIPAYDTDVAILICACFDYITLYTNTDQLICDTVGWQMYLNNQWTKNYTLNGINYALNITPINQQQATINEITYTINLINNTTLLIHDGTKNTQAKIINQTNELTILTQSGPVTVERKASNTPLSQTNTKTHQLSSPIPSTIVAILKNIDDQVIAGEKLMILEAMKMEHTIVAPTAGRITHIFYSLGAQVQDGVELMKIS